MTRGSTIFPAQDPALFRAKRFAPVPICAVAAFSAFESVSCRMALDAHQLIPMMPGLSA